MRRLHDRLHCGSHEQIPTRCRGPGQDQVVHPCMQQLQRAYSQLDLMHNECNLKSYREGGRARSPLSKAAAYCALAASNSGTIEDMVKAKIGSQVRDNCPSRCLSRPRRVYMSSIQPVSGHFAIAMGGVSVAIVHFSLVWLEWEHGVLTWPMNEFVNPSPWRRASSRLG